MQLSCFQYISPKLSPSFFLRRRPLWQCVGPVSKFRNVVPPPIFKLYFVPMFFFLKTTTTEFWTPLPPPGVKSVGRLICIWIRNCIVTKGHPRLENNNSRSKGAMLRGAERWDIDSGGRTVRNCFQDVLVVVILSRILPRDKRCQLVLKLDPNPACIPGHLKGVI